VEAEKEMWRPPALIDTGEGGYFGVGVVQKGVICSDCDGAVENEDAVGEG
jgi:hypothetical protein